MGKEPLPRNLPRPSTREDSRLYVASMSALVVSLFQVRDWPEDASRQGEVLIPAPWNSSWQPSLGCLSPCKNLGRLRRLNKTGCNLRCLRSLPEWSSKVVGTASACSSRDSSGICFCLRPCGSVLPGVPSMSALVERPLLQARSRAIFDTKPLFAGTGRQC